MTTYNPHLKIESIFNGEGLDMRAVKRFDPEQVYSAVEKRIAELQQKNYADPAAAKLITWLGDFVVVVWGGRS